MISRGRFQPRTDLGFRDVSVPRHPITISCPVCPFPSPLNLIPLQELEEQRAAQSASKNNNASSKDKDKGRRRRRKSRESMNGWISRSRL